MMSDIFFAEYMNKCIDEGKRAPHEICASAEDEIKQIDKRISEIEKLRSRQLKLHSIVRTLGGKTSTLRPGQKILTAVSDISYSPNQLNDLFKIKQVLLLTKTLNPSHLLPAKNTPL